ncbi:MAG: diguanylate cyclase [Myxococcota bacterium]
MNPTVLVVDDSESLRSNTRRILEQSPLRLRVLEAGDGAQALPIALSGDIDMVVSDIVMPKLDGIQLLRGIRQQLSWDDLPVILVTSVSEEDIRNESFEAGANDYLSRPFSPEELLGRIRVQLRLRQLQEDLRRANERHRRLGSHDELTGLANRRHLLDLCRRELSRSRRHKLAMTVAVVDIDHFRSLSKSIGPLAGDAIITEMASVLGRNLRTADVLARVAPQKFAVMLPHTDGAQGRAAGERLRSAACNHPYPGHRPGDVTVCVGVATYPSGRLESVDELVNAAESSLERARDLGGDRVEVWADEA